VPSNNALQPTPLRGPKIAGILKAGFVLTLVPINMAAQLNAGVRPLLPVLRYT